MLTVARATAVERGIALPGQRFVITTGMPMHTAGTTNTLHVEVI
jgi:pyruvate kinase